MIAVSTETTPTDDTYYWPDNIRFQVDGILFKVSRYQFILGSDYFAEKYRLLDEGEDPERIVILESLSADEFRVFLKFLFPRPSLLGASVFNKGEWLTILTLSTAWHFHEFRKLAIQHLDGRLTLAPLELILVGREIYHSDWVMDGYRSLIERPRQDIITEEEATAIGHSAANKLWIIRYQRNVSGAALDDGLVNRELRLRFAAELVELDGFELKHHTKEDIKATEIKPGDGVALREKTEEERTDFESDGTGVEGEFGNVTEEKGRVTERGETARVGEGRAMEEEEEAQDLLSQSGEVVHNDVAKEGANTFGPRPEDPDSVQDYADNLEEAAQRQQNLEKEKDAVVALKQGQLERMTELTVEVEALSMKFRKIEAQSDTPQAGAISKKVNKWVKNLPAKKLRYAKLEKEIGDVEGLLRMLSKEEERLETHLLEIVGALAPRP